MGRLDNLPSPYKWTYWTFVTFLHAIQTLFGLVGVGFGTFALKILSLMLAGRLYATKRGWGNTWAR